MKTMKQIKKRMPVAGACVVMALLFMMCNDDLGNYEYHDINTVTILGIRSSYVVDSGDTLRINPVLRFSIEESQDEYAYAWFCYQKEIIIRHKEKPTLWAETRNLEFPMTGQWARTTETIDYTCFYRVTNLTTGVSYISNQFRVSVRNPFAVGYLALCEKENGFDIDMIAELPDSMQFFPNLLSLQNSALPRQNETPVDIVAYWDVLSPEKYAPERYGVCILTENYTSRVHPTDYSYLQSYDLKSQIINSTVDVANFVPKKLVVKPGNAGYASATINDVGLNSRIHAYVDSSWYFYATPSVNNMPVWYLYDEPVNKKKGQTTSYRAAPYIAASSNISAILYNETDKTFMSQLYDYNSPEVILSTTPFTTAANTFMLFLNDPQSPGTERTLVYMNDNYAIVKDGNNGFRYVSFELNDGGTTKGQPKTFKRGRIISACPDLNQVKHWFVFQNYLFYATEKKVYAQYLADLEAQIKDLNREIDLTDYILNDDEYQTISLLKVIRKGSPSAGFYSHICAGTYSDSPAGQNGKLEIFRFDATEGTLRLAPINEIAKPAWKGLGKIVGLTYKEK
jgi:hypothetical protein